MRTIVTGGCGFVGSNLVDRLIEQNHEVVVVDNLATGNIENLNPRAEYLPLDIRNEALSHLPQLRADVIFHCAALARIQPSFYRPDETISVNCDGTVRILELARTTKAKVVYAGSSSFYFDPHANPYAHSKWIGEEHAKMYNKVYGVSVAIARFFNVYGPRHVQDGENAAVLGIFERQRREGVPLTVTGTGEQRRDFTHVADIVSGLIAMSDKAWNGEVFNLGRGSNFSINEVAAMFKSPQGVVHVPARPGEAWETLADISFSKEQLGWEPVHNLPDYVDEFLETLQ